MATYDCIVIGGGPAGSTTAALVAEAGFKTLLLERERLPRFHVGESLMPETYWTLRRLGVLEKMKLSHFPKKRSVQFVSHDGKESLSFYSQEVDNRECSQTWQVLRSEFDYLLFQNAAANGAECRDETRVLEVLFTDNGAGGQRACGVRAMLKSGETVDLTARVVVDATGLHSILGTRFGQREETPGLPNASIWAYYRGAHRDEGIDEGATLVLHTQDRKSWFWYIPLPDDITSVGVVSQSDRLLKNRGTPEEVFEEELCNCPAVVNRLMQAKLVSEFRVIRDFSFMCRRPAGDGWVLVGDAYGSMDPICSSGVFLALKSGEMGADCIREGLGANDVSARQLGKWCAPFERGMGWLRKLASAFYSEGFDFGRFLREYPHHKATLTNLLAGKVFHTSAGEVFEDLDPWLEAARREQAQECEMAGEAQEVNQ